MCVCVGLNEKDRQTRELTMAVVIAGPVLKLPFKNKLKAEGKKGWNIKDRKLIS